MNRGERYGRVWNEEKREQGHAHVRYEYGRREAAKAGSRGFRRSRDVIQNYSILNLFSAMNFQEVVASGTREGDMRRRGGLQLPAFRRAPHERHRHVWSLCMGPYIRRRL